MNSIIDFLIHLAGGVVLLIAVIFIVFFLSETVWHIIQKFFNIKRRKPKLNLILEFNKITIEGEIKMFSLKLRQRVKATLKPIDVNGDPAPIEDGSQVFNSTNPDVFRIELIEAEPNSCFIYSVALGTGTFEYSADADLGDGVKTISGSSNGEVIPREAVGFGLDFGEPEDV